MLRSYLWILVVLSIGLYANTLFNGFAFDDKAAFLHNSIVNQGITAIPEIFVTPFYHGFGAFSHDLYRPLASSLFALEYQLGTGSPFLGHLLSVLLFAADVVLLFLVLLQLFGQKWLQGSFLAALLFALLPIHTEVVANIKSQDELLSFFFSFLSLKLFLDFVEQGSRGKLLGGLVLYALALLSKETSVVFLGIYGLVFFGYFRKDKRRSLALVLGAALVLFAFVALRTYVLNSFSGAALSGVTTGENSLAAITSTSDRLATILFISGKYLQLLLVPIGLVCDYSFQSIPAQTFPNFWVLAALLFYSGITLLAVYRLVRLPKDWLAFAIFFFLISYSLFANVFFLVGAAMAERFMFLPSVGWCMGIAFLVCRISAIRNFQVELYRNRVFGVIFLPLALLYGSIIFVRNMDWKDDYTLFSHDVALSPNSYRLHQYLGFDLLHSALNEADSAQRLKFYQAAISEHKQSIALFPGINEMPYRAIGLSYSTLKQSDSAEKYLKLSLAIKPKDSLVRNNLAGVYFAKGGFQESAELCRINTLDFPDYQRAFVNLGASYLKLGKYDSAITALTQALTLDPQDAKTQYFLSVAREYQAAK
ncbi:MAG: tetratricopeptide repeat protein [Bacteroidetes bacterium]|nr:tetratricopeptide repeat protein [Bacteroidota bacterium]